MQNIETYTLRGEQSTALVYNNNDIESREVAFSEREFIDWIWANDKNTVLSEELSAENHRQIFIDVEPTDIITNELVLEFLNR